MTHLAAGLLRLLLPRHNGRLGRGRVGMPVSACGCLAIEACKYSSHLSPPAPMWQELRAVRSRLREEPPSEYRCCQRGHTGAPVQSPPSASVHTWTLLNQCRVLATKTTKDVIHCLNIIKPGNAPLCVSAGLLPHLGHWSAFSCTRVSIVTHAFDRSSQAQK